MASACRGTGDRSSSPRAGRARSSATGSTGRSGAQVETRDRATCRAIPTTSTAPRTATTGLALLGMRTPALDLALTMPGFRRRMARRVAPDLWLYPNINTGCVVKFDESGPDRRKPLGSRRPQPSDDHVDARAQGLSLSRRRLQQPDRPLQDPRRRPELDARRTTIGARRHDRRPQARLCQPFAASTTKPGRRR